MIGPQVASSHLMAFIVGVIFIAACSVFLPSRASGNDAILPQGDPRLQASDAGEHNRREEIRKNRLKQQEKTTASKGSSKAVPKDPRLKRQQVMTGRKPASKIQA
jgi:hypothetical protein